MKIPLGGAKGNVFRLLGVLSDYHPPDVKFCARC